MDAVVQEVESDVKMDRRETYAFVAFTFAVIVSSLYTLTLLDDMREHDEDPLLWLFVICTTNTAQCFYYFLFFIHLLRQLGKLFVQYRYIIWLDLLTLIFTIASWGFWMDYHSRMDIGLLDIFLMPSGITGALTILFLLIAIFLHFRLTVPVNVTKTEPENDDGDKI